ncbi:hypothetical protein RDABS01_004308, partial [Bienertia sinuspersici]
MFQRNVRWGKPFNMIAMLIKSCPLLETLEITLDSLLNSPRISIVAPNLNAYIDLTYLSFLRRRGMDAIDFVREISKFFVQLCSVRELHLESNVNTFCYMHSVNSMPLFRNLTFTTTTLTGSSGIIEFLGFLHVAPDLKEFSVTLNYEEGNPLAHMTQSYLECVNISGLQGNNDEVQLVGYILKNAIVLNELLIEVYVDGAIEDEDARFRKELKFCKACFRLLRSSSITWFVFS